MCWDLIVEFAGMKVLLPVHAEVAPDICRAIVQINDCDLIHVILVNIIPLSSNSNDRMPCFNPETPDIPRPERLSVFEVSVITLALWLSGYKLPHWCMLPVSIEKNFSSCGGIRSMNLDCRNLDPAAFRRLCVSKQLLSSWAVKQW
jgi:hypothetical protein